ncbi:hypothetical protein KI387_022159 [Taxus chinensis]|uniref:UBN2 domain-containing protein n=1 Tax=Taxus chinensis TaxID=29808 RepID=A0AA38FZF0_TAXCH|nr:hypothetical protein KI387_022159 [Taxus chinensis]
MKGLGEYMKEEVVVQKVLMSLTPKFDSKVSVIEETKDLNTLKIDDLHGTLITYEMRVMESKPTKKEINFKAEKKRKDKKVKVDDDAHELGDEELFSMVARRLTVGTGKYKGKLPFKLFSCGKVGHFIDKFPHRHDKKGNDDHEKKNQKYDKNKKEFKKGDFKKKGKKSFYTKEEAYSSEASSEADGSDSEIESDHKDLGDEVIFMTKEAMRSSSGGSTLWGDLTPDSCKENEGYDDGLRIELACVQSELEHAEKKNKKLTSQVKEYEEKIQELEGKHWGITEKLDETVRKIEMQMSNMTLSLQYKEEEVIILKK